MFEMIIMLAEIASSQQLFDLLYDEVEELKKVSLTRELTTEDLKKLSFVCVMIVQKVRGGSAEETINAVNDIGEAMKLFKTMKQ